MNRIFQFILISLIGSFIFSCAPATSPIDPMKFFSLDGIFARDGIETREIRIKDTTLRYLTFPRDFTFSSVVAKLEAALLDTSSGINGSPEAILGKNRHYFLAMDHFVRTRNNASEKLVLFTFVDTKFFPEAKFDWSILSKGFTFASGEKWMIEYDVDNKKFQNFRYAVPATSQSGSDSTSSPEPAPSP